MQTETPFFDVGAYTDPGRSRAINDDSYLVADLNRALTLEQSSTAIADGATWLDTQQGKLLVVADGITGAGAATMASNVALQTLAEHVVSKLPWGPAPLADEVIEGELRAALSRCQREIREAAAARGLGDQPVGSSVTLAYITWPRLYIAHAGDTRAYLWTGGRVERLTTDDTLAQQLVERNIVGPERSGRWDNVLVNAVGGESDELAVELHRRDLEPGDRVLLCTNGLTRYVDDLEIAEALTSSVTAATASRRLAEMAVDRGGSDNVTVVIAHAAE